MLPEKRGLSMCCVSKFSWVMKCLIWTFVILIEKLLSIFLAGMLKRSFKRKCFLTLVLESIARQRKLIILGRYSGNYCDCVIVFWFLLNYCFFFPDISFTGCFFVHLAGGQKMIEIIMATRDWTLLVLYLEASLEWFVFSLIVIEMSNVHYHFDRLSDL